ncbi:MAG: CopG family transcriptional regulator [bacterium]|nr:CopG family transcriptional regulator [bacterium]
MSKRGIIGIMISDWERDAQKVNALIGEYRTLIHGRMGVPDHKANIGTIALIIEADVDEVDAFETKLREIGSVEVHTIFAES